MRILLILGTNLNPITSAEFRQVEYYDLQPNEGRKSKQVLKEYVQSTCFGIGQKQLPFNSPVNTPHSVFTHLINHLDISL